MKASLVFQKRLQATPFLIWETVAKIDGIKGNWVAGVHLAPVILDRLQKSALITSTGASTRIEGAHLSDQEVEKLTRGLKIKTWAERDQQEVKGYHELLSNVFNAWESIPFSESSIKHLHQEMLKYVEKDARHRGDYKHAENKVVAKDSKGNIIGVVFDPTPPYLTPKQMHELVEWTSGALANGTPHPLLVIGNFIVEFLKIHPFQDGNGRLSRILTNLLLLKTGYGYVPYVSHEKLIEERKADYYLTLRQSQKTFKRGSGNITPWMEFFLSVLLEQAQSGLAILRQENLEQLLSTNQLKVWQYLGSVAEAAPGAIAQKTGVALPTVRQALKKFLNLKKIQRLGMGPGVRYRKI